MRFFIGIICLFLLGSIYYIYIYLDIFGFYRFKSHEKNPTITPIRDGRFFALLYSVFFFFAI